MCVSFLLIPFFSFLTFCVLCSFCHLFFVVFVCWFRSSYKNGWGVKEPVNSGGNRVVWPPVPSEPEEPYRNVALPAAFAPPSPSPTMQQNPFASPATATMTGVVDSDGIPFALDGLTPSPFAAAPANVVEPPTPVADVPPLVPTPVVEVPVRLPSPIPSTLTGLTASPISVLGYGGGGNDGSKPTNFGQMQQQQQQHHHHEPSNPGLAGFGSAAAVAASAAMAAQAQHQQQAPPPQLPPQMPQQPPKGAGSGIQSAPRRGKGVLNQQVAAGARVPVCASCKAQIRSDSLLIDFIYRVKMIFMSKKCVNCLQRQVRDGFGADVVSEPFQLRHAGLQT